MFPSIFVDLFELRNKVISIASWLAVSSGEEQTDGQLWHFLGSLVSEQRTGDIFLKCLPKQ